MPFCWIKLEDIQPQEIEIDLKMVGEKKFEQNLKAEGSLNKSEELIRVAAES